MTSVSTHPYQRVDPPKGTDIFQEYLSSGAVRVINYEPGNERYHEDFFSLATRAQIPKLVVDGHELGRVLDFARVLEDAAIHQASYIPIYEPELSWKEQVNVSVRTIDDIRYAIIENLSPEMGFVELAASLVLEDDEIFYSIGFVSAQTPQPEPRELVVRGTVEQGGATYTRNGVETSKAVPWGVEVLLMPGLVTKQKKSDVLRNTGQSLERVIIYS